MHIAVSISLFLTDTMNCPEILFIIWDFSIESFLNLLHCFFKSPECQFSNPIGNNNVVRSLTSTFNKNSKENLSWLTKSNTQSTSMESWTFGEQYTIKELEVENFIIWTFFSNSFHIGYSCLGSQQSLNLYPKIA